MGTQGQLTGELFNECAEWVWGQLQEDGFVLAGELVDLILLTERELDIHTKSLPEIAKLLEDEFRLRGITGNPVALEAPLIQAVVEWEDEFLGLAGILRENS